MNTFEITVQRKLGTNWPVVVEQSASGTFLPVRHEGTLQLDLVELTGQATPRDYGTMLGQALFRDEVRDAFVQALTKSDDRLHVLLFIEDTDLRTLRWERLCAPLDGRWDFLGLNQRVPFSLYLPSVTDQRFPPIGRRDLRALILVASPDDPENGYRLAPFDAAATVAEVRAALGEIQADALAAVEGAAGPPTLDALCERITAERYTLLHIVCHGWYKRDEGETVLYLARADNTVDPVPGKRLLERLGRLRGARGLPHFAFLSACESAVPEASAALGGLAQRLVQAPELGMPAVLAMTEKVSVVTAERLAEGFYRQLREHGEPDRALVEACAGLADRHDVNVPALYSRLGGRPLFSMEDRPLTNAEVEYGLTRMKELLVKRAPVLLPEFDRHALTLRGTLQAEFESLSKEARQEREAALDGISNLCDEALDLTFAALALGQEPPAYDERCPFRGLYPFRVEDREFFFGREALVTRLEGRLAESNFLAVLGPSGSGKSSVVVAGLVPALQGKESGFQMAPLTPGSDPPDSLEAALRDNQRASLLIVDQFEELFTLCTDDAKRRAFLDRLLQLRARMRVVLTMRADFWGECAPYRELKDLMQARQELVAPMDATELRRAMEMQAAKVGLRFEADLSNTILDDVQGEPGAMPLLQHALLELWKRRHGRWLRAEEYRALGGVKKAIAETAEAVYRDLSTHDQERVRDIFLRLTRLDEEALKAEERRDTRQRVRLDELTPARSDPAPTRTLVNRLADARLVVTSVNAASGREEVEVGHEALIRYWPRLRDWLEEDRATLRLREGIREAARDWETGGRDDNLLVHRGSRLEDSEAIQSTSRFPLNSLEQAYVAACTLLRRIHAEEKEAQRRRELEQAQALAASQRRSAKIFKWAAAVAVGLGILAMTSELRTRLALGRSESAERSASEQRRLALTTLRRVVDKIHARLKGQPNQQELRKELLAEALAGLKEVARAVDTSQADHATIWALIELGDIFREIEFGGLPEARKQYDQAHALARRLAETDPRSAPAQRDLAASLDRLGDVQLQQGDSKGALGSYQESVKVCRKLAAADPTNVQAQLDLSVALNKLGDVELQQGGTKAALGSYQESVKVCRKLAAADLANAQVQRDLAVSLQKLGKGQLQQGESKAALESYWECQQTLERLAGADSTNAQAQVDLAVSLARLSDVQLQRGDTKRALDSSLKALRITHKLAEADPRNAQVQRERAASLDGLGNVQFQGGDSTAALKSYQESLGVRRKLAAADPTNGEAQRALSVSLNHLGNVQQAQGNNEGALGSYQGSAEICRKLATADPNNIQTQLDLFVSLDCLGNMQLQQGDTRALDSYQESLVGRRKLAAADPTSAQLQQALAVSLYKLGDVQVRQEESKAALESYRECQQTLERLAKADPTNAQAQLDLAVCLEPLGDVQLQRGDTKGALESFRESLRLIRKLAAADPTNAQAQRELGVPLNRLGGVQLQQGDTKGALESFQEFLEIARKLADADPKNAQVQGDLFVGYSNRGNLALQGSDFRQAADWYAKALEVPNSFPQAKVVEQDVRVVTSRLRLCRTAEQALDDLAVVDKQPADERPNLLAAVNRALVRRKEYAKAVQAAEKLAGIAEKARELYNAACAFALCVPLADKDEAKERLAIRAVELLRQAVAKGYKNIANMKQDADLDALRQRDDFKKVLADLEKMP
jgi:tetratricopeptide (TPR) repeat protein/energy-coupling factor transporter ATP-binding protein EcfA2